MAVSISCVFTFFSLAAGTLALLFALMRPLSWSGSRCEAVSAAVVWCSIFSFFIWFLCHPALFSQSPVSSLAASQSPPHPQHHSLPRLSTKIGSCGVIYIYIYLHIHNIYLFIALFLNELRSPQLEMLLRRNDFQNQRKKTK